MTAQEIIKKYQLARLLCPIFFQYTYSGKQIRNRWSRQQYRQQHPPLPSQLQGFREPGVELRWIHRWWHQEKWWLLATGLLDSISKPLIISHLFHAPCHNYSKKHPAGMFFVWCGWWESASLLRLIAKENALAGAFFYFTRYAELTSGSLHSLTWVQFTNTNQTKNTPLGCFLFGAGGENRTHVTCLEGRYISHYTTPAHFCYYIKTYHYWKYQWSSDTMYSVI